VALLLAAGTAVFIFALQSCLQPSLPFSTRSKLAISINFREAAVDENGTRFALFRLTNSSRHTVVEGSSFIEFQPPPFLEREPLTRGQALLGPGELMEIEVEIEERLVATGRPWRLTQVFYAVPSRLEDIVISCLNLVSPQAASRRSQPTYVHSDWIEQAELNWRSAPREPNTPKNSERPN
jgi:hypothetical protein